MPEDKPFSLISALCIQPGTTSVIGGGGKSSLLLAAGRELGQMGKKVILCTSTHFLPLDGLVPYAAENTQELRDALTENCLIQTGCRIPGSEKLGPPPVPFEVLQTICDYLLIEADGSAGLPMKAHAAHEPVIPACSRQTVAVVGASGFGRPIREAAHRPVLFAHRAGLTTGDLITPRAVAAVLQKEGLHTRIYVNQAETEEDLDQARELARLTGTPLAAGALRDTVRHVQILRSGLEIHNDAL